MDGPIGNPALINADPVSKLPVLITSSGSPFSSQPFPNVILPTQAGRGTYKFFLVYLYRIGPAYAPDETPVFSIGEGSQELSFKTGIFRVESEIRT
jgi:hypothetical protein